MQSDWSGRTPDGSERNGVEGRTLALFLGVSFGLSIALSAIVGLTGGHESPLLGLRFGAMFIPAVAVLITGAVTGERARIDWERFPVRFIPVALLLLPLILHATMLPVIVAYEERLPWQDWLTPGADGLYHAPPERG